MEPPPDLPLVCYTTTWRDVVLASFSDSGSMKFTQPCKQRTLQPGPNYPIVFISLASPALSLRATSTLISSLHKHVVTLKILESLKIGSAGPDCHWSQSDHPERDRGSDCNQYLTAFFTVRSLETGESIESRMQPR